MQPRADDNLQTWLATQQHRLVALSATLDDMARASAITQQLYFERRNFLKSKINLISQISAIQAADSLDKDQVASLGLPQMEHCSRKEREVCAQFLSQRLKVLQELYQETAGILHAARESGRQNPVLNFLNIFRLSKMRRLLARLDYCLSQIGYDEQDFNAQVSKLVALFQNDHAGKKVEANLRGLMSLFQELEQINIRVARLKNDVAEEEGVVANMEQWLNRVIAQEQTKKLSRPAPASSLRHANEDDAIGAKLNPLAHSEKRLVLARQYVETCLSTARQTAAMYQELPPLPPRPRPTLERQLLPPLPQLVVNDERRRKPGKKKRRK